MVLLQARQVVVVAFDLDEAKVHILGVLITLAIALDDALGMLELAHSAKSFHVCGHLAHADLVRRARLSRAFLRLGGGRKCWRALIPEAICPRTFHMRAEGVAECCQDAL